MSDTFSIILFLMCVASLTVSVKLKWYTIAVFNLAAMLFVIFIKILMIGK